MRFAQRLAWAEHLKNKLLETVDTVRSCTVRVGYAQPMTRCHQASSR
jgi:hypothetical protein